MATIKSFTDISQSKVLAEILPHESADMCYSLPCKDGDKPLLEKGGFGSTPCWSLTALLGVLPYGYSSILTKSFDGKDYYCKIDGETFETDADNPIDACYEMILKLHELNLL